MPSIAALLRVWLVVLALLVSPTAAAGCDRVILVFGDSLSTGYGFAVDKSWVSLLQRRLARNDTGYKVKNASISGETTRGGRARIDDVLKAIDPGIVIVELGGNDGLRGIDLDATEENLTVIVKAALASGAEVLLLAMELPPNYGPSYIERFRQIYSNIAGSNDVHLVPFFLDGVAGDPKLMQADGIHPTAEAQPTLLENIWPHLSPLLVP